MTAWELLIVCVVPVLQRFTDHGLTRLRAHRTAVPV